jgi:hypothetical protein
MIVRDRHRRAVVDEDRSWDEAELVEFEAGPVARGRRRFDPVILASVAVSGLLLVAVMKPWGPTAEEATERAVEERTAAEATRGPSSRAQPGMRQPAYVLPVPGARPSPLPPRRLVLAALETYDAWGARTLLETPRDATDGSALEARVVELWQPATPPMVGGVRSEDPDSRNAIVFELGDRNARLIGITMPESVVARGVHVTVSRPLGRRTRVNVVAVPDDRGVSYMFAPATLDGRINAWPPGTYVIALEVDGVRTAVTIVLTRTPATT